MLSFVAQNGQRIDFASQYLYRSGAVWQARQSVTRTGGGGDAAESWGRSPLRLLTLIFDPLEDQDRRGLLRFIGGGCFWHSSDFSVIMAAQTHVCRFWTDSAFFPIKTARGQTSVEIELLIVR